MPHLTVLSCPVMYTEDLQLLPSCNFVLKFITSECLYIRISVWVWCTRETIVYIIL
jgi:hypothetical protein